MGLASSSQSSDDGRSRSGSIASKSGEFQQLKPKEGPEFTPLKDLIISVSLKDGEKSSDMMVQYSQLFNAVHSLIEGASEKRPDNFKDTVDKVLRALAESEKNIKAE